MLTPSRRSSATRRPWKVPAALSTLITWAGRAGRIYDQTPAADVVREPLRKPRAVAVDAGDDSREIVDHQVPWHAAEELPCPLQTLDGVVQDLGVRGPDKHVPRVEKHYRHPSDSALFAGVRVRDPDQPAVVHLGRLARRTRRNAHGAAWAGQALLAEEAQHRALRYTDTPALMQITDAHEDQQVALQPVPQLRQIGI